ncbi:Mdm33 family-domain-containing protein [Lanmaoa asiatica]|nr:Mdm33 family-domain-containing protein [Lanmaoa asiatica]
MLRTRGTDRTAAFRSLSHPGRHLQGAYSTRGVGVTPDTGTSPRNNHTTPTSENISTIEPHTAGPVPGRTRAQSSLNSPPPIKVEALRGRLRDWGALAGSSLRRRADQFSKRATTAFSHLGLHLNRVTGYEEIDALKRQVVEQGMILQLSAISDGNQRKAKTTYDDAVLQRSISQRQVNDLLQRKSSWTDTDVNHFTSLVRSDHSLEQEEACTKARVAETEDAVDREFSELMRVILARYHEEQVWSDKIRSASTYGSLAVLGINLVVFIMAIVVVEPWKRKRLAQTFEQKVEGMGAETKTLMNASTARLEERLTGHEKLLTELIAQVSAEAHQGVFAAATAPKEASPEETPVVLPPPPSQWYQVYFAFPRLGVVGGRELMLVAGSAADWWRHNTFDA